MDWVNDNPCPHLEPDPNGRQLVDGSDRLCCGCPPGYRMEAICPGEPNYNSTCVKCEDGTSIVDKAHKITSCMPIPGYIPRTTTTTTIPTTPTLKTSPQTPALLNQATTERLQTDANIYDNTQLAGVASGKMTSGETAIIALLCVLILVLILALLGCCGLFFYMRRRRKIKRQRRQQNQHPDLDVSYSAVSTKVDVQGDDCSSQIKLECEKQDSRCPQPVRQYLDDSGASSSASSSTNLNKQPKYMTKDHREEKDFGEYGKAFLKDLEVQPKAKLKASDKTDKEKTHSPTFDLALDPLEASIPTNTTPFTDEYCEHAKLNVPIDGELQDHYKEMKSIETFFEIMEEKHPRIKITTSDVQKFAEAFKFKSTDDQFFESVSVPLLLTDVLVEIQNICGKALKAKEIIKYFRKEKHNLFADALEEHVKSTSQYAGKTFV
uniref:Fibropellin-3-like n=1 Tax=Phallusia mammillata TaxID=59560 RepID=A0A6F9DJP7_9ASCI|nr:fibropellin-3-like [Phallusia mammillata]